MLHKVEEVRLALGDKELIIQTGHVANQAGGAVIVRLGDTMVLATACASDSPLEAKDFFPLTVDYREKAYAAGKIPGGFFKREGRPTEKEILSSRLIDRPMRPLFPDGYLNEVQLLVQVLSSDQENDSDVLGIIGAGAALAISAIPFEAFVAGVRVGRVAGKFVIFPTISELESSDLNIVAAGTADSINMVEGGGREVSEPSRRGCVLLYPANRNCRSWRRKSIPNCSKPLPTWLPTRLRRPIAPSISMIARPSSTR